jgi:hypothetical protein
MLPTARSDVSMLADSRDEVPRDAAASDATSAPPVAAWELAPARNKLREWTLTRLLATRPAAEPVVFNADTPIGEALQARIHFVGSCVSARGRGAHALVLTLCACAYLARRAKSTLTPATPRLRHVRAAAGGGGHPVGARGRCHARHACQRFSRVPRRIRCRHFAAERRVWGGCCMQAHASLVRAGSSARCCALYASLLR